MRGKKNKNSWVMSMPNESTYQVNGVTYIVVSQFETRSEEAHSLRSRLERLIKNNSADLSTETQGDKPYKFVHWLYSSHIHSFGFIFLRRDISDIVCILAEILEEGVELIYVLAFANAEIGNALLEFGQIRAVIVKVIAEHQPRHSFRPTDTEAGGIPTCLVTLEVAGGIG